jgi:hypothetical protein
MMKISRLLAASLFLLCLTAGAGNAHAMTILEGEVWQGMSHDEKTAFIWGVGHLATFEYRAMEGDNGMTQQRADSSLIPPLVETLRQHSINEVVTTIDNYYRDHPDQVQRPVLNAIFQTLIFPTMGR